MQPAPQPLRFGGLVIPNSGWVEIERAAKRLESLDFDLIAVDDHVSNPVKTTQRWAEAWTVLGAIAAATSTIRLGPLVANTILRHPVVLARQALTVIDISGGRLELGLGAGYAPTDFAAVEHRELEPVERSQRFAEAVGMIHRLLRGEGGSKGSWFDTADISLRTADVGPAAPPLTIAADGPIALDTAARWGDRWVSFGGWGLSHDDAVAVTRRRSQQLDERCDAHGREPTDVGRTLLAGNAAVNADPIWTSVAAFEDFVGRFREVGIDTFVFYWPPASVSRSVDEVAVETIVTEVMPRLRAE